MLVVDLNQALKLLEEGKVLIYPTETSYALGCDATNDAAVARVFAIKGRDEGKGTPVILPHDIDPKEYVDFSEAAQDLAQRYWPGPLNIIVPRAASSTISPRCETRGTQSVRKTSHNVSAELAWRFRKPLVATSANRSGKSSLYRSADIIKEFSHGEMPDAFLDVGDLPEVSPSTTVQVVDDKVLIVRQGDIVI